MKMMRWMKTLECCLLISFGALLFFVYALVRIHGLIFSRPEVERFRSQQMFAQESNRGRAPDFSLWSTERIRAYEESLASHFQPAVALLRIPKIRLEVPVLEGTNELILNRAVGHISGTPAPGNSGNIGIAGHRDGFFRGLKDIAPGDAIEIVTQKGCTRYVVDQITIVYPSDVSVLRPRSRSSVTLVTCYPFYSAGDAPKRYIVQASLVAPGTEGPNTSNDADL